MKTATYYIIGAMCALLLGLWLSISCSPARWNSTGLDNIPNLAWDGELNPTELGKWEVTAEYPNPTHVWLIAKNPDEWSKIYFVVLLYDLDKLLVEYRYWLDGEPYVFEYVKRLNKYEKFVLPDWKRKQCFECHKNKIKTKVRKGDLT